MQPCGDELQQYYCLVKTLLLDIDAVQHRLDKERHQRMRNGMVRAHNAEKSLLRLTYGDKVSECFTDPFFDFISTGLLDTSKLHAAPSHAADTGSVDRPLQRENHGSSVSPAEPSRPQAEVGGQQQQPFIPVAHTSSATQPAQLPFLSLPPPPPGLRGQPVQPRGFLPPPPPPPPPPGYGSSTLIISQMQQHQKNNGSRTGRQGLHHGHIPTPPHPVATATYVPGCDASASVPDQERLALRCKHMHNEKKWAFVTLDRWNYRLVDITDMDSVETLRAAICHNLGISDWSDAQIFQTEPGQAEHEVSLDDSNLVLCQRVKADASGSLKLLVCRSSMHLSTNESPLNFAGLAVSLPEELPASSPTVVIHRKPLDDEALNRIAHPPGERLLAVAVHRGVSQFPVGQGSQPTPTSQTNTSPAKSSATTPEKPRPRLPVYDFDSPESNVPFEDSDDVSDEGLFAKPLANRQALTKDKGSSAGPWDGEMTPLKPPLTVNIKTRLKKKHSANFQTLSATREEFDSGSESASRKGSVSEMGHSPDSEKPPRRNSFARDVWASSPPVEGNIDQLDNFFPDIDLRAPCLDFQGVSPPSSPAGRAPADNEFNQKECQTVQPHGEDPAGRIDSAEPTARPHYADYITTHNLRKYLLRWTTLTADEVAMACP